MRRTLPLAVGAFVSFASVASAADLPVKAPSYLAPAPVFSWTGFYIGAHAGYGWSNFTGTDPTGTLGTDTAQARGFLGGLQLGYNYQMGSFVLGVEGDYSWADVKRVESDPLGVGAGEASLKNDYFATLALRLGYAFNRTLIYGKAGGAWTRDKWDINDGIGGTATGTFDRTGWMLGLGVEYAFWNSMSAKIEYNYLDFRSINQTLTTSGGLTATPADVSLKSHLVKLGVNYRF